MIPNIIVRSERLAEAFGRGLEELKIRERAEIIQITALLRSA